MFFGLVFLLSAESATLERLEWEREWPVLRWLHLYRPATERRVMIMFRGYQLGGLVLMVFGLLAFFGVVDIR